MEFTGKRDSLLNRSKEALPKALLIGSALVFAACSGGNKDVRSEGAPSTSSQNSTNESAKEPKVVISEDGCEVTISGEPGLRFTVLAFTKSTDGQGKGGVIEYTIPESGTETLPSGGVKGMTTAGEIWRAEEVGTQLAYAEKPITAEACAPAPNPTTTSTVSS